MQITINNIQVEVAAGETLLETARRAGHEIPALCHAERAKHKPSCMVCAVSDCATGQIILSCATLPAEGMKIETDSEEAQKVRRLSLELLLSDHRADCEAPCSMVCPKGLDVERMLNFYDAGRHEDAHAVIAAAFALPTLGCDGCKAPCEKICRRGTVDNAVNIRAIISKLAQKFSVSSFQFPSTKYQISSLFQSRLGRFSIREKKWLKKNITTPSGCLHCACAGREGCKLRLYASAAGIKRPRYEASSATQAMAKQRVTGNMRFEPAKCIRCGLCVYNSDNGFTFKDRGFGMQVVIPDENRENVSQDLAKLCPTGALWNEK